MIFFYFFFIYNVQDSLYTIKIIKKKTKQPA
jgi:hypothetical protein